ncbi:SGNH/GDSL hydrolase family protein [bacterium]|nr:SGNH/GDSL hydrolase family protein [bacterium]
MAKINRRIAMKRTLQSTALLGLGALWQSGTPTSALGFSERFVPSIEDSTVWLDVADWEVEGRAWKNTSKPFDRFPAKAEASLRKAVWGLSRHSAGMVARFSTDSAVVKVRYQLSSSKIAMNHMPATGVSGVDLYAETDGGELRWVNVSRPTQTVVEATLASGVDSLPDSAPREFALYFPLYNGVEKLEIGIREGSELKPMPARKKPIVFYGTSIMHGACASRPGMSISSILGRRLNSSVVNLGFSGNGKMELPVADLIGELDPSIIAIDCLPNMNSKLVSERAVPFVQRLRQFHPETPVLLVEDRAMTNSVFYQRSRDFHKGNRASLKAAYQSLLAAGEKNIYYLDGQELLGKDGEGATDGSHPSDLGMVRYADAYEPVLQDLLEGKGTQETP